MLIMSSSSTAAASLHWYIMMVVITGFSVVGSDLHEDRERASLGKKC